MDGHMPPLSGAASHGVDLHELERLRMLVRFEFPHEVPRDQLISALHHCQHNTRDAYHFLKRQHQAQATTMPAKLAEASPSSSISGTKRHSEAREDMAMETKRQRSDTVDVDLSQDENDEEDTQPIAASSIPQNIDEASRMFHAVVRELFHGRSGPPPERWMKEIGQVLSVDLAGPVGERLVAVTKALAQSLQYIAPSDVAAVQTNGIDQILEVMRLLPRVGDYNVALQLNPSDSEFQRHDREVDEAYEDANAECGNRQVKAEAARKAISVITAACASCIARKKSIRKFEKELYSSRQGVRSHVEDREHAIARQLAESKSFVESSERELAAARTECAEHSRAQNQAFGEIQQSLQEQGIDVEFAAAEATMRLVASSEIAPRLQQRQASFDTWLERKKHVLNANTRLVFYQQLHALLGQVKPRIQDWLTQTSARAKQAKLLANRDLEDKLRAHVPKMTKLLEVYYDFQSLRQHNATEQSNKLHEELELHSMLFADLAPTKAQLIQKGISEFNAIVMVVTKEMREVAMLQSSLWKGKQALFSPEFFATIESEYGQLWSKLDGGAKEMMRDCVAAIMSAPVPVASAVRVSATVATEPTTQPFQFVSRVSGGSAVEVTRGAASKPTSPVVDLTGDVSDDEMNGSTQPWLSASPVVQIKMEDDVEPSAHFVSATSWRADDLNVPNRLPADAARFQVGKILFARVQQEDADDEMPFFRGEVKQILEDGKYLIRYDDGSEYTTGSEFLYTPEQMNDILRHQHEGAARRCAIM